jgi:hypothetical protein
VQKPKFVSDELEFVGDELEFVGDELIFFGVIHALWSVYTDTFQHYGNKQHGHCTGTT